MKKEIVAMLLAGGQGTRLFELTDNVAKPAVHFGGKYRIIDFPLSNCVNSNITTVGVLTQYEPLELTNYIGIGSAWDLDIERSGVSILAPYQSMKNSSWYEGTAHAIFANLKYLEFHNPEYVAVLSGDHIYKMDYNKMLLDHKKNNADLSIAVMEVPMEEAPRFGIMNTDETLKITEFEEKPKNPKSNLASMGVYIFNYQILKKYLEDDALVSTTNHDFGMDIIPKIIADGCNVYAYRFSGYWKDVGTIQSLWEANMDMINDDTIDLFEHEFRIYSKNTSVYPQLISKLSDIKNCMINEGSIIHGKLRDSVISYGVVVESNASLDHVVVMPNVIIEENASISYAIIQDNVIIKNDVKIHGSKNNIILISNKYLKENGYE